MLRTLFALLLTGCCLFTVNRSALAQTQKVNEAHEKLKTQADQAYRRGNFAETVKLTNQVLKENSSDHVAYYLRGSARIELAIQAGDAKEMRGGITDAREAIRLDGSRSPMYYLPYLYGMTNLAQLEHRKEHAEVSVKFAGQLLGLDSMGSEMRSHVYYQRGLAYAALGKYNEAAADFQSAIKITRTHLGAHLAAADAYARAGKFKEAEEQFNTAVKTFADHALVVNNRGMFYQQREEFKKSIDDFTKAISLDSKYYFAYTNRGFSNLRLGNFKEAEADFTKSLEINDKQPNVHSLRASARLSQGKVAEALADNQKAIELAPKAPAFHADLGFTLFFGGKFAEADKAFQESLTLDNKQQHLAPWRYLSMEIAGKKDDALRTFQSMIDRKPDERNWVDWVMAFLAGKVSGDDLIAAAGKKEPEAKFAQRCEAHYFVGLRLFEAKKNDEAKTHFEKAIATKQDHLSAYQGSQLALRKLASQ